MKRNLDLVRKILLAIEKDEDAIGQGWINLRIDGHSQKEISYHVELLNEAGLIEATDLSSSINYRWCPVRLTWYGHEFLDSARDEDVWKQAKDKLAKKTKNFSFELLKTILIELTKESLGL